LEPDWDEVYHVHHAAGYAEDEEAAGEHVPVLDDASGDLSGLLGGDLDDDEGCEEDAEDD
jgi:hypothetical protein